MIIDWESALVSLTSLRASAGVLPSKMLIEYKNSVIEKGSNANCSGVKESGEEKTLIDGANQLQVEMPSNL